MRPWPYHRKNDHLCFLVVAEIKLRLSDIGHDHLE